jgi:uncharacterized RDD family membrane protein YckC
MADYFVKGDDGEEYGPVTMKELGQWVKENRAGRGTLVKQGEAGPWERWEERVELLALEEALQVPGLFPNRTDVVLAKLYQRMLAYGVDLFLILLPIIVTLMFFLQNRLGMTEQEMVTAIEAMRVNPQDNILAITTQIIFIGAQLIYFTFYHGKYGATPGKRLLGLRILNEQGAVPGYPVALLRTFASLASEIYLFVGHLVAVFNRRNKTLHDFIARTVVVKDR